MAGNFYNMDRRTALVTLGSSGLALLALNSESIFAVEPDGDALQKILPALAPASRKTLQTVLNSPAFTGQIPGAAVKELVNSEGKDVGAVMLNLLPLARTYSRPPISNYHVGAVVRGVSGSLYPGANLEISGHSLGFSVHAEQAALSNAYMHSEPGVVSIAVTAAPCGHCRQFMQECSPASEMEILLENKPSAKLSSLLPLAFGPNDLGFRDGIFPVREMNLAMPHAPSDELTRAALRAARHSYAPYSESHSGVAITTKTGRVHEGSYLENAAFNPSLSPLQTALVQLILAGDDFSAISRVALVEDSKKISQLSVIRAALSQVAPSVELQRFPALRT
jgi:cytidine deaminase